LQIEKTPFKLKHGEPGRKESSIYLNHRHVIYSDKWDRRLLAEVLYYGISEHLLGGEKDYGVVAIESTSSPELTSILLDYFPGIKRAVIVPEQMRKQEKNHRRVYGDLEGARNWILIDDVFTSGKTMRQAIDVLADEGLGKGQVFSLVHRDDEAAENFKHGVGYDFGSLTSLDQILSHHWGKLGKLKRDLVKKERMHFI
jgi:orotate phosphoribosyltransferase